MNSKQERPKLVLDSEIVVGLQRTMPSHAVGRAARARAFFCLSVMALLGQATTAAAAVEERALRLLLDYKMVSSVNIVSCKVRL